MTLPARSGRDTRAASMGVHITAQTGVDKARCAFTRVIMKKN
jgi:hypothetical protein